MSITAVGDIMLHLKRIKNYDCLGYGSFKIKIEIFRRIEATKTDKARRVYSIPYLIPEKPFEESKSPKLEQPSISIEDQVYHSQTFMFRSYTDSFDLNEIIVFKFEKPIDYNIWDFEIKATILIFLGVKTDIKSLFKSTNR